MGATFPVTEFDKSLGPAEYNIISTMRTGKHPTLEKKSGQTYSWGTQQLERPPRWKNTNPGPGNYEDKAFEKSSFRRASIKYTIQGREAWKDYDKQVGPGVGTYNVGEVMRTGK